VIKLAFDVAYNWIFYLNDLVATQAIPLSLFQLAMGLSFYLTLCLDPCSKLPPINPKMVTFIPAMGSPLSKPIP
jgi:hypothetical protein